MQPERLPFYIETVCIPVAALLVIIADPTPLMAQRVYTEGTDISATGNVFGWRREKAEELLLGGNVTGRVGSLSSSTLGQTTALRG